MEHISSWGLMVNSIVAFLTVWTGYWYLLTLKQRSRPSRPATDAAGPAQQAGSERSEDKKPDGNVE